MTYEQYSIQLQEHGEAGFDIVGGHDSIIQYGNDIRIMHEEARAVTDDLAKLVENYDFDMDELKVMTRCERIKKTNAVFGGSANIPNCNEVQLNNKQWHTYEEGSELRFSGYTTEQYDYMQDQLGVLSGKLEAQIQEMLDLYTEEEYSQLDRLSDTYDVLYYIAGDLLDDLLPGDLSADQSLEERSTDPSFLSGESDFNIFRNPLFDAPGVPLVDIDIRLGDGYNPNFLGAEPLRNIQTTNVEDAEEVTGGPVGTDDEGTQFGDDVNWNSTEGPRPISRPPPAE